MDKPKVVAEIGGNHGGSFAWAKRVVEVAAECGADYVKFQKRDIESLPERANSTIRTDAHAFGATEFEHRKALEFSEEQHLDLQAHARAHGISYACSAWDQKSFDFLKKLECDYIKIPSARNQVFFNWSLRGCNELHVSLGMLSGSERDSLLRVMSRDSARFVPYACTSKYPCGMDETYLLELPYLAGRFGRIGFSGHHDGIAVDLAAAMLGAGYIERHFTLDREAKGTDQKASLAPEGLLKLNRDLTAICAAMRNKPGNLPECELEPRRKLKGE